MCCFPETTSSSAPRSTARRASRTSQIAPRCTRTRARPACVRQGPTRPFRQTLVRVVRGIIKTVVHRQLAPDDQLVEEDVHRSPQLGSFRRHLPHPVRHVHHADLAVVDVRREVRLQAQGRVVAGGRVVGELTLEETIELAKRLSLAADVVAGRGLDAPVHADAEDGGVQRVEARVHGRLDNSGNGTRARHRLEPTPTSELPSPALSPEQQSQPRRRGPPRGVRDRAASERVPLRSRRGSRARIFRSKASPPRVQNAPRLPRARTGARPRRTRPRSRDNPPVSPPSVASYAPRARIPRLLPPRSRARTPRRSPPPAHRLRRERQESNARGFSSSVSRSSTSPWYMKARCRSLAWGKPRCRRTPRGGGRRARSRAGRRTRGLRCAWRVGRTGPRGGRSGRRDAGA